MSKQKTKIMDRVKLKNIQFSEWNSRETNCFMGDIFFDNKKVGQCKNDGHGGETWCYCLDNNLKDKFKELVTYCKNLPDFKYGEVSFKSNLEFVVDTLFQHWLEKKNEKSLLKDFSKGICVGTKNFYKIIELNVRGKKIKIEEILKTEHGITFLKKLCEEKRKEGLTILNTNLPF